MPNVYKRTLGSRVYHNYSIEKLTKCLNDVREKTMTQREAAKAYNIPRRIICYKLKEQHSLPVGRPKAFTDEEESNFIRNFICMSDFGFPIDKVDLRFIIKSYLDRIGRHILIFPNNLPGLSWTDSFINRHKELSVRLASKDEPINQASTSVSVQHLSEVEDCPVSKNDKYNVDNFVIFTYLNNLYLGLITKTTSDEAIILSMEKSKKNYRWPEKEDLMFYKWSDIMMKINPPKLIRRGYFQIPELDEYTE